MRFTKTRVLPVIATHLLILGLTGCTSGHPSLVVNPSGTLASFPADIKPSAQNTYRGSDSVSDWTLVLDDDPKTWSYTSSGNAFPAANGTLNQVGGFQSLGTAADGSSLGLLLEIQGRLALFRPGSSSNPLVVSVPQSSCYDIPYKLRFSYLEMDALPGGGAPAVPAGVGSVVVSTNMDGTAWHYEALEGATASGPAVFDGSCSAAAGSAALDLTGSTVFADQNNGPDVTVLADASGQLLPLATNLTMGPSGIFVAHQYQTPDPFHVSNVGVAGLPEPAFAITAAHLATGNYLGFVADSLKTGTIQNTTTPFQLGSVSPVAFTAGSTQVAQLVGGAYFNEDPTQATAGDTTISLGSPSATVNGVFPGATLTRPDPNQLCTTTYPAGVGVSAAGYPTCTFPVAAVAGTSDGKYVLFLSGIDHTIGFFPNAYTGVSMQLYLYQQ